MKLLIRQHLQQMKERGQLDVLIPELLSEMGYEVIHHPRIGGRQAGVDVAAVGPDPDADGEKSLLLFVIKQGDIGRVDWSGAIQSVRPSLEEVLDDYIPNRISRQHSELPVAVCVALGGEIQEGIRSQWRGFTENKSTDRVRFREWNGDRLSNLILSGVLGREFLDSEARTYFHRAVALVGEPDQSYHNFRELVDCLAPYPADEAGTKRLRQVMICLWVLVGNGIDAKNLDSPYRACELALLYVWDAVRRCPKRKGKRLRERREIFQHVLNLFLEISYQLLAEKAGPCAGKEYALSAAVRASNQLDVNLALFDLLGRVGLAGLWFHYLGESAEDESQGQHFAARDKLLSIAISVINSNPTLFSPMRDDHQIELALLMLLAQKCDRIESVEGYLREVSSRLAFRLGRRIKWPTHFRDYRQLAQHPVDRNDTYFRKSTAGSVLIPFLLVGLERIGAEEERKDMESLLAEKLPHTTLQVWVPSAETDDDIWTTGLSTGVGLSVSIVYSDCAEHSLSIEIDALAEEYADVHKMEAIKAGLLPVLLTALRHHRIPVPPHCWFSKEDEHPRA